MELHNVPSLLYNMFDSHFLNGSHLACKATVRATLIACHFDKLFEIVYICCGLHSCWWGWCAVIIQQLI